MSLIELLIVTLVLGIVMLVVTLILTSSSHAQAKTAARASIQGACREAMSLMSTELRQAGADPKNPPAGVTAIVYGDSVTIHVRSDLNGDGVIETAEPSEDVTYSFNPTTQVITRDPGSGPSTVLANVSNMRLSYFDSSNNPLAALPLSAADAAAVHSIALSITSVGQGAQPITLSTQILLRNR